MKDLLKFDSMVTPKIITFIYWLMLLGVLVSGLGAMFGGYGGFSIGKFFSGLLILVGGAVFARVWCELLIVMFKMNDALQEIRKK